MTTPDPASGAASDAAAPLFVFGTLRDADVRRLVLGDLAEAVGRAPATLPDHRVARAAEGPWPVLVPAPGATAGGEVLYCPPAARAALDRFEARFGYAPEPAVVHTRGGPVHATLYRAGGAAGGPDWSLAQWRDDGKPLFLEMAREVQETGSAGGPGLMRRALARLAAAAGAPRGGDVPRTIADHRRTRAHEGFFALDVHRFRHATFAGGMSEEIRREVFMVGDAVTVLPWDPHADCVLLIEQVRAGPIGRGDPDPWCLEVVAGLLDRPEDPAQTARREAREEAGLEMGRLERIGGYYASPGAVSEYLTSFIGEARLAEGEAGLHGVAAEHEDIRAVVMPRTEALAAIDRGAIRNAPAILSLLALERHRARLAAAWGALAGPGAAD